MDPSAQGPPYLSNTAAIGGVPTLSVDVPLSAVFMTLYLLALAIHITIFRYNNKSKATRFRLSILLIYLCFIRIITLSMRIAWATQQANIRLAIAAQVFTTAGVLLFILNLIFAQRLLRAQHPHLGWHSLFSAVFPTFYVLVVLSLIALVTCFVQSLYTLDPTTRSRDRGFLLYGTTFFLVAAFLPVPFIALSFAYTFFGTRKEGIQSLDRNKELLAKRPIMKGNIAYGSVIVVAATVVLTLGQGFRTGATWAPARPADDPAWYHSKASFWCFNFVTEIAVVYFYAPVRVDRMFCVHSKEVVGREGEDDVAVE